MGKLIKYFHDVRVELQKVIFPTKEQVRQAFFAVLLVVTVIALFLALVDVTMSAIVSSIL